MEDKKMIIKIKNKKRKATLRFVEESDRPKLRRLFDDWKKLSARIKKFSGTRGLNIHEGITEFAFALELKRPKLVKISGEKKFDNYDIRRKERIQVKSSSNSKSPSSFGPTSKSDIHYYLDFDRGGKLDGSFNAYRIPNNLIEKFMVNKKQEVTKQKKQKRRPRFTLMDVIKKNKIRYKTYSI